VLGTREARQVGANLGDQHIGGARADTGDGLEQRGRVPLGVGDQACFQLSVQTRDGRVQGVQMGKLLTRAAKPWWASRRPTTACASASRLARSFPRASSAKAWLCVCLAHSRRRCRISRAAEAAHIGSDGGELAVGVFAYRLQSVGQPGALGREATRWRWAGEAMKLARNRP
jgi:hypothetical protein